MKDPSFDTWTIIFLFSAIQGIFLTAVLFFQKSKMTVPNRYLGIFILLFSLTLIDYFTFWSDYRYLIPHLFGFSFGFPFVFGPILYLYIFSLNRKPVLRLAHSLHFVPALAFYLVNTPYYLLPAVEKIYIFNNPVALNFWESLVVPAKFVHMAVYTILAYLLIKKAEMNSHNQAIKWQKVMISLFVVFMISSASYYILVATIDFKVEYDYMISLSMSFAIYSIGYLGYRHPQIIHGFETARAKYENSSLKKGQVDQLVPQLERLLKHDKVYLQNDLKLGDLSQLMGLTSHQLSQLVNEQFGMSFPDLINSYRINDIKKCLSDIDYQNKNIIELAYDVGFNNKANFNNAFKKFTGISPSQYRKHQLELTN